jgi:hypothetical protein
LNEHSEGATTSIPKGSLQLANRFVVILTTSIQDESHHFVLPDESHALIAVAVVDALDVHHFKSLYGHGFLQVGSELVWVLAGDRES